MPRDVEGARAWRLKFLDPARSAGLRMATSAAPGMRASAASAACRAVIKAAKLAARDFIAHGHALRAALRLVPRAARSSVELDETIWRQLIDCENLQAWCRLSAERDAELGRTPSSQHPSDDEATARLMDDFMYQLAAGELTIGRALPP